MKRIITGLIEANRAAETPHTATEGRGIDNMRQEQEKDCSTNNANALMTRRKLFEFAGLAIGTAALPPAVALAKPFVSQDRMEQAVTPVIEKLSRYMSEAGERALPDEVVEKAKQHILDTLAAMISGSGLPPGRAAINFIHSS